jgi:hypothetical protein
MVDDGVAGSGLDHVITHGICEACAVIVLADIEAMELVPGRYSSKKLQSPDFQLKRWFKSIS